MLRHYEESRERHDGFARHRENHTFHHHSEENSYVAGLMDERGDIGRKEFRDSHMYIEKIKVE